MDIEEGLQNRRSRVMPQVVQGNRLVVSEVQPTQSLQSSHPPKHQKAQQSRHQRFRPSGRQFKKKSGSSSSGSGSSISGSPKVEFCASVEENILRRSVLVCKVFVTFVDSMDTLRECFLWHSTAQCVGVQGSQHTAAPPQGRSRGSRRGRSFLVQQQRLGEPR
ncbi:C-terminal domain phosphatase-like 4 [Dorcoceras hygrometricum]|uniref:C-terminal domain phosphatase-like 4 n=1 Tax=Dorcoceras hygrometricum TaxID=472368 RepID=A0A2Z7B5E3_9LAMI|nr:C-terminal domain phosphatase-like 4 [Dorcoceras hygrometricum]